jgi:hypothetical protein
MAERLELPRPMRLLRISGWNLAEAFGFPVAAWAIGTAVAGRIVGLWAMLAVIWIAAATRQLITRSVPGLVWISAVVLTVQTAVAIGTGSLWIFLIHFPIANLALAILFARSAEGHHPLAARLAAEVIALREPPTRHRGLHRFFQDATWLWAGIFLLLAISQAVLLVTVPVDTYVLVWAASTVVMLGAGAGVSIIWILAVLRRFGIKLGFETVSAQPGPGPPGTGNEDRQRSFIARLLRHRPGRVTPDGVTNTRDTRR